MNSSTQREEEIFDFARQLDDPAEQAAYLDRVCAGAVDLRRRVERLLAAAAAAENFFAEGETALSDAGNPLRLTRSTGGLAGPDSPALLGEEKIGTCIGHYRLLEKLGEGGCGVVYLAEQQEPVRRSVALKIIKLGMETNSVIARFEAERQALALMDHPNIARVFDAGATERGSPYFVMELVSGVRITDYCDQHNLDPGQRLDLFIQICHAIQHAHQKGVIHRDIKPSNIIITLQDGAPVPKVIDFGIAKATETPLTDKILHTAHAQFIGTPAYMSPEQAEMGRVDIDTRSDIYSLGVLLYELLTGRTPFDAKVLQEVGLDEMRRMLREVEPPRPSRRLSALPATDAVTVAAQRQTSPAQLISRLRGDLDWIAMKALEKDRTRRYETANGLAADVQRHLGNEPVMARPPSRLYRLGKLVRRNRGVFVAGAAVVTALVAGFGTSTWLYVREKEARNRAVAAERQQTRLRHAAEARQRITQAALLVSQEHFAEADRLLHEIEFSQPTVEGAAVLRSVGEWHAVQDHWPEAAGHFGLLLKVDGFDGLDVISLDYLRLGPALVEIGDFEGYRRFCREILKNFTAASCPFPDRVLKICLLASTGPGEAEALAKFADVTAQSLPEAEAEKDAFREAWRAMSLALWEYRRGNDAKAVAWCRQCLSCPESNPPRNATAHLICAMASRRRGATHDAATELAAGREIMNRRITGNLDRGTPVRGFWFDWEFARILLREAEAGTAAPAGAVLAQPRR